MFGEALLVDPNVNHGKNGGFASILGGLAIHGAGGELLPFVSVDFGIEKGLLVNRRETHLSIGVRFAPF